jgi:hypothetical protein
MAEKAKYSARTLTQNEKKIIDQVFLKYVLTFYAILKKYPDPREYAKKVLLKKFRSGKNFAALYTIAIAQNEGSEHLFSPGKINKKLAKDLAETISMDDIEKDYIHPRNMSEVLNRLNNEGIFVHLEGKKEIGKQKNKRVRPGKKVFSTKDFDDHGGKPSAYKITEEFRKQRKVMENAEAIGLFHKKLIESNLAFKLAKYKISVVLHAMRMDETLLFKTVKLGETFFHHDQSKVENGSAQMAFSTWLQSLDEPRLERLAVQQANSLISNHGYNECLMSLCGLFKL